MATRHFCDICGREVIEDADKASGKYRVDVNRNLRIIADLQEYGETKDDQHLCQGCLIDTLKKNDYRPQDASGEGAKNIIALFFVKAMDSNIKENDLVEAIVDLAIGAHTHNLLPSDTLETIKELAKRKTEH